jgi:hypothetical protein
MSRSTANKLSGSVGYIRAGSSASTNASKLGYRATATTRYSSWTLNLTVSPSAMAAKRG